MFIPKGIIPKGIMKFSRAIAQDFNDLKWRFWKNGSINSEWGWI